MWSRAALAAALISPVATLAAGDPVLTQPVDCTLGQTCYIQNHVDRDPGPGFQDFMCGSIGYDGHKGTDFGVPTLADMRRGVDVLAAAPGIVAGLRDGVADIGATDATAGRECGNGVVLRHADGWETQYCHLKSGSVRVKLGEVIGRSHVLGQVGLSGLSEFPHLHLSVRQNGTVRDPFDLSAFSSCGRNGATLWKDPYEYTSGGLLDAGFTPGLPDFKVIKDGTAHHSELAPDAAGLVLYGYGFGGRNGDVVELSITGPSGQFQLHKARVDKEQATYFRASGKRLTTARWPAGRYQGTVTLRRGDTILGVRQAETVIR